MAFKLDGESLSAPSLEEAGRGMQAWVTAHWMQILIAVGAGLVVYLILTLVRGLGRKLAAKAGDNAVAGLFGRAVSRTTQAFLIVTSARLVAGYANPPPPVLKTISFFFTVVAVFQAALWIREVVLGLIERRTAENGHGETLANAMGIIRILVSVALFAIAAVVVLDNVGVNVTGLVAGLGIGGIAIGLAAQGIFSDLFAALSIIFDRPFRIGETITYDQTTATVENIGLKSTRLRAVTGEKKVISNADLLKKEITNLQGLDHRRVKFTLPILYEVGPDAAARIPAMLEEIVKAEGGAFVRSGLIGFGANGLDFEVEFDVFRSNWDEIYKIRHRVGVAILKRLHQEGVGFSYNGRTIAPAASPEPSAPR
jgi:small-conductance mechanosensitive channel